MNHRIKSATETMKQKCLVNHTKQSKMSQNAAISTDPFKWQVKRVHKCKLIV